MFGTSPPASKKLRPILPDSRNWVEAGQVAWQDDCVLCNQSKGATRLPNPTQAMVASAVRVFEDGRIEGTTREAQQIIRLLGLDGREETEARLLWIGIIALAQRCDPTLYERLMGFPENLPDLRRLRPPGGNARQDGVMTCFHSRRRDDTLPSVY